MKRVKITGVSKVTKEKGTNTEKGRNVGQGEGGKSQGLPEKPEETSGDGQGTGAGRPGNKPGQKPEGKKPEKKGPGQITLSPEEKMPEDFIKKIREAIENPEDWDIGKVGRGTGTPGKPIEIVDGEPVESEEDEPEDRSWGENAEQKIDQAIKE